MDLPDQRDDIDQSGGVPVRHVRLESSVRNLKSLNVLTVHTKPRWSRSIHSCLPSHRGAGWRLGQISPRRQNCYRSGFGYYLGGKGRLPFHKCSGGRWPLYRRGLYIQIGQLFVQTLPYLQVEFGQRLLRESIRPSPWKRSVYFRDCRWITCWLTSLVGRTRTMASIRTVLFTVYKDTKSAGPFERA